MINYGGLNLLILIQKENWRMTMLAKSKHSNLLNLFLALDSRRKKGREENLAAEIALPAGSNVILETIHQAIKPGNKCEQRDDEYDEWESDFKQWGDDQVTYPDGSPWVNGWEDAVNNPK
jgi:hypothetical protein